MLKNEKVYQNMLRAAELGDPEALAVSLRALAEHMDLAGNPLHRVLRQHADRLQGALDAPEVRLSPGVTTKNKKLADGTWVHVAKFPSGRTNVTWQPEPGRLFSGTFGPKETLQLARQDLTDTEKALISAAHEDPNVLSVLPDALEDEDPHILAPLFRHVQQHGPGEIRNHEVQVMDIPNSNGYQWSTNPFSFPIRKYDHVGINVTPLTGTTDFHVSVRIPSPDGKIENSKSLVFRVPQHIVDTLMQHVGGKELMQHEHLKKLRDTRTARLARKLPEPTLTPEMRGFIDPGDEGKLAIFADYMEENHPGHPLTPILSHWRTHGWGKELVKPSRDNAYLSNPEVRYRRNKGETLQSQKYPMANVGSPYYTGPGVAIHIAPIRGTTDLFATINPYTQDAKGNMLHMRIPQDIAIEVGKRIGGKFNKHLKDLLAQRAKDIPEKLERQGGLSTAVPELNSKTQQVKAAIARQIMTEAGMKVKSAPLIHVTPESVSADLLHTIDHSGSPSVVRYASAWYGLLSKARSLITFHPDPNGTDFLHILETPRDLKSLIPIVQKSGIPRFAVQPKTLGSRLYVFNPGGSKTQTLTQLGSILHASHSTIRGFSDPLGSSQGPPSRAREQFRTVIEDYERTGGGSTAGSPKST